MGKSKDAFRTISEVADWLDTQAHVLRFWESKFSQVKPVKRAGGRRYYRPADMRLLGGIKKLLHDDGMTIKGAQKLLREKGVKHVAALSPPLDDEVEDTAVSTTPIEVQPPAMTPSALPDPEPTPAEVVAFAQPAETADPEPEDPSEMEGDLFQVNPVDLSEPEGTAEPEDAEEPPAPVEGSDDLPSQDELPAFLQRVTFDTTPGAKDAELEEPEPEAPTNESEPEPAETKVEEAPVAEVDPVPAPEPEPTPAESQSADVPPSTDSAPAAPTDQRSMEPAQSLLPNRADTQEIAAENRAEAQALLAQLAALRARMAESENA